MTHEEFARLADIGRYPVKGLGGESLAQAEIGQHGIRWDRAFAMSTTRIPIEKFGTWTSYEAFHALDARPDLGGHSATMRETGPGGATLELHHRDGTSLALGVTPDGRVVTDENSVATIQSWFAGPGARAELISSGTHLWDVAYASVSIINLATIREISTAAGVPLDHRRFRANLYIDGLAPWDELALVGTVIRVGEVELDVLEPIIRCSATSVDPDRGGTNVNVPGVLGAHFGHGFCGVYARVRQAGRVRIGDSVARDRAEAPRITAEIRDAATHEAPRRAEVLTVEGVRDSVTSVSLRDSFGLLSEGMAGQHLKVHSGTALGTAWRSYTISRASAGVARITVAHHDGGTMSPWIAAREPGDHLLVSGPFGDAALRDDDRGPLLVLTAGIGITPALAIAHALADARSQRRVDFVHVERSRNTVAHGDELIEAASSLANATLHLFVTGPNASEHDRRGRPTGADVASLITDPLSTSVVVCGPQGFVAAMKAAASAAGVPDAAVRSDPFYSPRPANFEFRHPPASGPFTVRFTGTEPVEAEWTEQSGTLLDVAESLGIRLPFSCRSGLCGTCVKRVNGATFSVVDPLIEPPPGTALLCAAVPVGDIEIGV